jgi:nucleotide-binding universal stress UspA family protein
VLLVPEDAEGWLGKPVVVAYDGSQAAQRAMASFAATGLAAGRDVLVATVEDRGDRAWEIATAGVKLLAEAGVVAEPRNIVSALSNVEALFQLANQVAAGVIVMGAFAHSRLAHLFHGSVTRGLLERTTIPVYLQH